MYRHSRSSALRGWAPQRTPACRLKPCAWAHRPAGALSSRPGARFCQSSVNVLTSGYKAARHWGVCRTRLRQNRVATCVQDCIHAPKAAAGRFYRPRKPRTSALYQCTVRHAPELRAGGGFGRRVEENVVGRFLACGDPQHGFARIYCDQCRHGFILAFSCKARYFCPSCHQKRVLAYGE
ncbi:MAG: hypothetical protein FJY40_09470, partial [Betaproteobacteria bacterium]|nr:hypothetical protein [Betaproteobacteria bacterium]